MRDHKEEDVLKYKFSSHLEKEMLGRDFLFHCVSRESEA